MTPSDLEAFWDWGVRRVLDLRSAGESPELTCAFARADGFEWENVALFDYDISAPTMIPTTEIDNYLVTSYLHMLTSKDAVRRAFELCAGAPSESCVLFHCAAGMDRTGVLAMLLLGLAEVPREQVVADYALSFGTATQVGEAMARHAARGGRATGEDGRTAHDFASFILDTRIDAAWAVYDAVMTAHGSIRGYLESCSIAPHVLDAVLAHLVEP